MVSHTSYPYNILLVNECPDIGGYVGLGACGVKLGYVGVCGVK